MSVENWDINEITPEMEQKIRKKFKFNSQFMTTDGKTTSGDMDQGHNKVLLATWEGKTAITYKNTKN
jgi:hypothetical protein